MSFIIQGPVPDYAVSIILPSPEFGDGRSGKSTINVKRSMNGETRTYVKRSERQRISYSFLLDRMKAEELKNYIKLYSARETVIIDHNSIRWSTIFTNVEFAFTHGRRTNVALEYEGVRI